ncbi:uncharacterized protein MONBRDRAFT_29896 [Monosiga brevicollis MX1]|uniref:Flavoprotein domain-containing protein n=1 Tax=Monosiga brevicollis TaxID=81824 RepID=A9VCF9_MONBE|nr:uncharacterized protein MONBRDRAFT_29896 [Monosiga brevicollis MX1]EDQ84779.1 predicted protein [Monosiga brevicollis MX1]|eukprot:XP_001750429.1 hypothetical protein [Monosiga brevicollis MX1]
MAEPGRATRSKRASSARTDASAEPLPESLAEAVPAAKRAADEASKQPKNPSAQASAAVHDTGPAQQASKAVAVVAETDPDKAPSPPPAPPVRPPRILIGFTGSVAAIKAQSLVEACQRAVPGATFKLAATAHAEHFLRAERELSLPVLTDRDEWTWQKRGDAVMHIELRKWADVLVIAPLSANTMAKLVHGLCDNLVTCIYRAWDLKRPVLVAPAMNTLMWEHPITAEQVCAAAPLFPADLRHPEPKAASVCCTSTH